MPTKPKVPRRKSMRLSGYDYTQPGVYFVTICTYKSEQFFGTIQNGVMELNDWGHIAMQCWQAIPEHLTSVRLDEWVIMPNHIHGILLIEDSLGTIGAQRMSSGHLLPQPLGTIEHLHK